MPAITKTMAFDSAPPEPTEGETTETPEGTGGMPEAAEGESVSLDLFGDKEPKVGDRVTFQVTAVDPENGTASLAMPMGKKMGGIAGKAAAMDEEDQASITA